MISTEYSEKCCGCSACKSVCPKSAIDMLPDALGFLYPKIDLKKCIDCGLCERVCNFKKLLDKPLPHNGNSKIYACRLKDETELSKSQSGGAAYAISKWVIDCGGKVYGATFKTPYEVVHKRAASLEECSLQRGSKYIQSRLENSFINIKKDLSNGSKVLFTGTGCQVNGLLEYLKVEKADTTNLYTMDIICHGVASPQLWYDYSKYIEEKKVKKTIIKSVFRDKYHYGWNSHKETFYISDNQYYTTTKFAHIFYQHIALRPACCVCPYATMKRTSDFTVCDFWGYQKIVPEMGSDNKGLSMLFINNLRAVNGFTQLNQYLLYKDVSDCDCCLQPNMMYPTKFGKDAKNFENAYKKYGFTYILKKYGRDPLDIQIKSMIRRISYKLLGERKIAYLKTRLKVLHF